MENHKITPIENVYVQLATLKAVLEKFIKQNEMKFSERKRGIYIRPEDLEEFITLKKITDGLIEIDLPYITQKLQNEIVERSNYEGKYKQSMYILEKCYNDYVNNGRQDAVQAINEGLNENSCLTLEPHTES